MATSFRLQQPAGIGLRLPHLAEFVATQPGTGWLEIHPENFLANPHATELLIELSKHYPISVHTVGISIGSASGIDRDHLRRIQALVEASIRCLFRVIWRGPHTETNTSTICCRSRSMKRLFS